MPRRSVLLLTAAGVLLPLLALIGASTMAGAQDKHPTLRSNGSRASFAVQGGGKILIHARATPCRGFPTLRVWIDGKLDRTIKLNRRKTKRYVSARSYAVKKHRVVLILRRDKKVTKNGSVACNRRARVMKVAVQRPGATPPSRGGDGDGAFTFAVIGDTQNETVGQRTTFSDRTRWLADHAKTEDLRFVAHTGDFTNFGWAGTEQYSVGRSAMEILTGAGIPWQVSAGNHDTMAVGWDGVPGSRRYGGSAYEGNPECAERLGPTGCDSRLLVREADEFTESLPGNPSGAIESGYFAQAERARRAENSFATFAAERRWWLVLNLELWPRPEVVAWARRVVATHPNHNVIVQTHSYLVGDGRVNPTNGGYGATSGTYLEQNLISKYGNIKLVVSGHTGLANHRTVYYGKNRVVAFLGNEGSTAVTRLISIDARTGTVSSRHWAGSPDLSVAPDGRTTATGFTFR